MCHTYDCFHCVPSPPGHVPVLLPVPTPGQDAGVCQQQGLPAPPQLCAHAATEEPTAATRRHAPDAEAQEPGQVHRFV